MGWFSGTLKDQASRTLTYRRGNDEIEIAMTVGSKPIPQFSVLGSTPGALDPTQADPQNAVRSFSFDATDLNFGAGLVTPEEGDEILETIDGVVCVFRCMPPSTGQLAWGYRGQHRGPGARYIVHTQLVDTE
jgi:hypothetical protein